MKLTHISAQHRLFDLRLGEVWEYRELIGLFARRKFRLSYRQTILGPLWVFLNPLLTSLFYLLLFGKVAKLSTDGIPQLLFYMSGHALWTFFSGRVNNGAGTFNENAQLFGKVYFPRLVVPLSDLVSGAIQFGIQLFPVLLASVWYYLRGDICPSPALLILPLVVILVGLMGVGVGIIISSFTTKYRDLAILVGFGLQLWMYATPIVYPLSSLNGGLKTLLLCNPMTAPAELLRLGLFGIGTVSVGSCLYALLFTITVLLSGIVIFNKVERTFMDTV